jgi:hypothetical protein
MHSEHVIDIDTLKIELKQFFTDHAVSICDSYAGGEGYHAEDVIHDFPQVSSDIYDDRFVSDGDVFYTHIMRVFSDLNHPIYRNFIEVNLKQNTIDNLGEYWLKTMLYHIEHDLNFDVVGITEAQA